MQAYWWRRLILQLAGEPEELSSFLELRGGTLHSPVSAGVSRGVWYTLLFLPLGSYLVPLLAFLFLDLPAGSVLLAAIAEGPRFGPFRLSFRGLGQLELVLLLAVF